MPEPGMGANNDHSTSSTASSFGGGSSSDNDNSTSSDNTTSENISSSNTTADNLSSSSSDSDNDKPTTAESLASSPTTADNLSNTPSHSYDEVPSVAVSLDVPEAASNDDTSNDKAISVDTSPQLPEGVPEEYAELFGVTPKPVGGVDAVWANGDGTYSSSDGSTYNPTTGEGTYDPGEDSFATTRTSTGITLDGQLTQTTVRDRHPDRVRTSESLALVEHDPKGLARAYGNRAAFDYYNNPNMDSIRDEALMHAAARANEPVSGRYPGENLAYLGVVPFTAHLARSVRLSPTVARPRDPGTVTVYRVDDANFAPRISADGTIPVVTTKSGGERALFINIGQPKRAREFAEVNRNNDSTITAVEADASLLTTLRNQSVYDKSDAARANPNAPLSVDVNKASDQFGLRTPEQIQMLRDKIDPTTTRIVNPNDL